MINNDLLRIENSLQRMELLGWTHTRGYKKLKHKYEEIKGGSGYEIVEAGALTIKGIKKLINKIILEG